MPTTTRLRILALHGYHGNAALLRAQLQPLASAIEPIAEIICVDAPSLAAGDFGWWHAVPDRDAPAGADSTRKRYRGWSRTRDWLLALAVAKGRFDGVLGFSQGAALAGLLAALCAADRDGAGRQLAIDFAILVGGFASADPRHAALYEPAGGIAMPSLHIIGRRDAIVSSAASLALAARFAAPVIAEHDGGHVIASTPMVREAVQRFLDDMARRKTAAAAARPAASPIASPIAAPPAAAAAPGPQPAAPPATPRPTPPRELPLWPGRAHPAMQIHVPDDHATQPRPALLVFRGGGYAICNGSGGGTAAWLARRGIVGIEVEYSTRATRSVHPAAYSDAARAMRLVRHHARDWGIDPGRIGALGYSAGGHLVSLLSTQPTLWLSPDDDLTAHHSARPDLVVLSYPLISFVEQYRPGAFANSIEHFFGSGGPGRPGDPGRAGDITESARRQFSTELFVEPGHPPVFLWTTADDDIVPDAHSERFAEACQRAGVRLKYLRFPSGPHGMGLALDQPGEARRWTEHLQTWLDQQWGAR